MVKSMERLAAEFSTDPEQTLPEAAIMESAKSYREKKAKPVVEKLVRVLRSVYSAYLDIFGRLAKLQSAYSREQSRNERLRNRLEEVLEENRDLRIVASDFWRVKTVFGSRQMEEAISWAKQQEQPIKKKSVMKRLERAKENIEIRDNGKLKNKPKGRKRHEKTDL